MGRSRRLGLSMLVATAGMAAMGAMGAPAFAQSGEARDFDVVAQPLADALIRFGVQSGLQVAADGSLTASRRGQGVSGRMGSAEALSRLLAGTGLSFTFTDARTVQLALAPKVGEDAVRLGAVRVEGAGAGNGGGTAAANMDPVRTEGSKSYAPVAVNVGKTAQTLREIPQSVTVMTQQRLADQALLNLDDVLLQVTGVTRDQAWLASTYSSRGLTIENVRYDGGATSTYLAGTGNADTALFDNVALLRGADGLFGAGEAGGVINLSHKRPLIAPKLDFSAFGGSWNNFRGEADATGALGFDGHLRARFVGVVQDEGSFIDYKHSKRYVAYGGLEADLGPDTLLFVGVSHQDDQIKGFDYSLSRYSDGSDPEWPRSKNMGAPWSTIDRDNTALFGRLDQTLGGDWAARLNVRYNRNRDRTNAAEMENAVNPITRAGTDWWYYQKDELNRQLTADLNINGSFELFGQHHNVMIGIDTVRTRAGYDQLWTYYGSANIFDPVFPPEVPFPPEWGYRSRTKMERSGLYGSLRVHPVASLSLIGGGRWVFEDDTVARTIAGVMTSELKQKSVFVPYFGIVYDVAPTITLYGSYAEIYQSQADRYAGPRPGTPLAPVTGSNYEFGIKGAFAGGKLTASAAVYRVEKKGAASADPAYPTPSFGDQCCYIRDGYLRSQGFEVELNGEIFTGWQASIGYTYNDNKNIRSSDTRFSTITPKHLLKIWSDYRFPGTLEGFRIGGGVTGQSKNFRMGSIRQFNPASGTWDGPWVDYRFSVKGYTVWSARVGYDLSERTSIGVNINNLFDKTYLGTITSAGYGNFYGTPRNVLVTLKTSF